MTNNPVRSGQVLLAPVRGGRIDEDDDPRLRTMGDCVAFLST